MNEKKEIGDTIFSSLYELLDKRKKIHHILLKRNGAYIHAHF